MEKKTAKTVLDKLMDEVISAYIARKPLIMIDTMEIEVVRDVAYHRLNPLGVAVKDKTDAFRLLEGDEEAECGETLNIMWHGLEEDPLYKKQQELFADGRLPFMTVMGLDESDKNKTESKRIAGLRSFVKMHCLGLRQGSFMLLYGDTGALPEDLAPYCEIIDVQYPGILEIESRIRACAARNDAPDVQQAQKKAGFDKKVKDVAQKMRGLSYVEVDMLSDYLLNKRKDGVSLLFCQEKDWSEAILRHKQQSLKRNGGLLELQEESDVDIGGLGSFSKWVDDNSFRVDTQEAHKVMCSIGASAPKGVLLHGTRGCGKSELARFLQKQWGLPLIKMDIGRLMGGYLGDSERHMRNALRQAEACAPCILWIDEIEKGLSGTSSDAKNSNDSIKRMFSYLLSWLSDDRGEATCFVFATANSLDGMPDELFRKGRMDVLFSVGLPTKNECVQIFKKTLQRMEKAAQKAQKADGVENAAKFRLFEEDEKKWDADLSLLIEGPQKSLLHPKKDKPSLFVSGADINEICKLALIECYKEAKDMSAFPIRFSEFIQQAKCVISSDTMSSTGYGEGNMKGIAHGYAQTLRGAFVPASEDKEVMFTMNEYRTVEKKENSFTFTGAEIDKNSERHKRYTENKTTSAYDKALYEKLLKYIEKERE